MKLDRIIFILIANLLCSPGLLWSQTDSLPSDTLAVPRHQVWHFKGNLIAQQNDLFSDRVSTLITENAFQNRLALRWTPNARWTARLEVRNRIVYGEYARYQPGLGQLLEVDPNWLDLAFVPVDRSPVVWQAWFDRALVQYADERWAISAGRQRINWGISLFWNPNDLFNTYNFLQVDYPERPGSDALRIACRTGEQSSIEAAVKPGKADSTWVGAALYRFHKGNYDLQMVAGIYQQQLALGGGWAGDAGSIGFKGECTVFVPMEGSSAEKTAVSATLLADRTFSNDWYAAAGILYASAAPARSNGNIFTGINFTPSARTLMPFRYSALVTANYTVNELLTAGMTVLYGTNDHTVLFFPSVTYSLRDNWDLMFFAQSAFANDAQQQWATRANQLALRLSWAF